MKSISLTTLICLSFAWMTPAIGQIPGFPSNNNANVSNEAKVMLKNGFQHPSATGYDVSMIYQDLTGKRVILSAAAAQSEFRLIQPGPFSSVQEATQVLEKILVLEGWAIVPSGPNEVKLLLGGTNNPKAEAQIITSASELPLYSDQLVTYLMTFQYLKPDQAQTIFMQIIGNLGVNGSMTVMKNINALAITENTAVIRKLVTLKAAIDKPSAAFVTRWIPVEFADAETLVQTLNELYGQSKDDTSSKVVNDN